MNPIFEAALEIQQLCLERDWKFCFFGAIAVQRCGEPRLTQDVDLTILTGFGLEEAYVEALLDRFKCRLENCRDFAIQTRVVRLESGKGVPIDVALGAMPFEERAVSRASEFLIASGVALTTCSAEDLIVFKAFANREKDWLDIESIAVRQHGKLDETLILSELRPLLKLKKEPAIEKRLRKTFELTH